MLLGVTIHAEQDTRADGYCLLDLTKEEGDLPPLVSSRYRDVVLLARGIGNDSHGSMVSDILSICETHIYYFYFLVGDFVLYCPLLPTSAISSSLSSITYAWHSYNLSLSLSILSIYICFLVLLPHTYKVFGYELLSPRHHVHLLLLH